MGCKALGDGVFPEPTPDVVVNSTLRAWSDYLSGLDLAVPPPAEGAPVVYIHNLYAVVGAVDTGINIAEGAAGSGPAGGGGAWDINNTAFLEGVFGYWPLDVNDVVYQPLYADPYPWWDGHAQGGPFGSGNDYYSYDLDEDDLRGTPLGGWSLHFGQPLPIGSVRFKAFTAGNDPFLADPGAARYLAGVIVLGRNSTAVSTYEHEADDDVEVLAYETYGYPGLGDVLEYIIELDGFHEFIRVQCLYDTYEFGFGDPNQVIGAYQVPGSLKVSPP
jgi:hypothetical protein